MNELNEAYAIVQQSRLIHPDWTPEDHLNYLVNDAFIDEAIVERVRARGFILEWLGLV